MLEIEKNNIIIDSHSHIGPGLYSRDATINEYEKIKEQYGICFSLLMPQPIMDINLVRNQSLFDSINDCIFDEVQSSRVSDELSFVPMVSPIYTSPYKLEEYIVKYKPLAFKIHYKSDCSYPELISEEWIRIIKKYNVVLIVHTDYSINQGTEKARLKNLNSALKWFSFLKKNDIKGYLTHGARLNPTVLEQINNIDNIVIGIGPDLLLQDYSDSSLEQRGNYLEVLYNSVDPRKLVFDLDYNWNLERSNNLDMNAVHRMKEYWNEEELKLILHYNSKKIFAIQNEKK